jgi:hypothetical protein
MAAGLGFKTFTTGEVLSAGDVNGYLMQGVLVFASAAARNAAITSPQEGQFAYLKDTDSTTYYTGSAWAASGGGGGKVLQVVQAEYSTGTTIASTTFTDTGLTASITPSASNSKVLVLVSQPAYIGYSTGSGVGASAQIVRGATAVFVQGAGKDSLYFTIQVSGQSDLQLGQNISMIYLDSPATTSATTYKTQAAVSSTASGRNITAQYNSSKSTITLIEIGA